MPGDVISVKLGDIIPADARLFDCPMPLKVRKGGQGGLLLGDYRGASLTAPCLSRWDDFDFPISDR